MNTIFILLMLVSFVAVAALVVMLIVNVIRKKETKTLTRNTAIAVAVLFVSLFGSIFTTESEDKESADEPAAVKADEKTSEANAKTDADQLAADKEYYLNEIESKVTTQMGMYDAAWSDYWVATFEGISAGTVDVYTAYDNMKQLKQRYDTLYSSFSGIDASGLSKEREKQFKEFVTKIRSAVLWRSEVAEKAQKMFDEGDFSPSKFDDMKRDVTYADNDMMNAVIILTTLKSELGLIEEAE